MNSLSPWDIQSTKHSRTLPWRVAVVTSWVCVWDKKKRKVEEKHTHTLGFSPASYEDEDVKLRSRLVSTATVHNDGMTHLTSMLLSPATLYE
ncbi:hypothetical protein CHARACLAT_010099 [Characodon lateralis]|uniref:Uncharacterized protein n=1 Tax=Characodon lateralis TaxID=208331 RepID=A0ABU7D5H9_9TELE|nr:hypothetical protein [Characodon lateralis]